MGNPAHKLETLSRKNSKSDLLGMHDPVSARGSSGGNVGNVGPGAGASEVRSLAEDVSLAGGDNVSELSAGSALTNGAGASATTLLSKTDSVGSKKRDSLSTSNPNANAGGAATAGHFLDDVHGGLGQAQLQPQDMDMELPSGTDW